MHSIFSNVEVYINNQQIYNSNGLNAHKSYISNNFKGAIILNDLLLREFCIVKAMAINRILRTKPPTSTLFYKEKETAK